MKTFTIASLLLSTAISTSAYAETTSDSDIIVTARKTEENLNDVPVSIRVFDEENLRARSAVRAIDLPGIGARSTSVNSEVMILSLHGQAQTDPTMSIDHAVGIYVDGVYVARSYGLNNNLLDIKNIEVLYGPQGTLFGRNSTGGAVLINSNDPDLNAVSTSTELTYGRFNEVQGTLVTNIPLSDNLAVRIAGTGVRRDGFVKDSITGKDLNNRESYQIRGKVLYEPTDTVRTVLTGEFYDSNGRPDARQLRYGWGAAYNSANINPSDSIQNTFDNKSNVTYGSVSSITDIGDLKVILGWRRTKTDSVLDVDGGLPDVGYMNPSVNIQQWTAETQYEGSIGSNLEYIVGGFYFNEEGRDSLTTLFFNRTSNQTWNYHGDNESYGAFVNASYTLGKVTVNGGARFTHDNKKATTYNYITTSQAVPTACVYRTAVLSDKCVVNYSETFDKVSWTAGLDYRVTDNALLYAKVATGYRSGGINAKGVDTATALPFNPETLIEYQVGLKGDIGNVRYSFAGFYNEGKDVQTSTVYFVPFPTNLIRNAAETRALGGEATISAKVTDKFNLALNGLWVDPKYKRYNDPRTGADISDSEFNMVVKKQFTVDASYALLDNVTLHANYVWTDRTPQSQQSIGYLTRTYGQVEGSKIYQAVQTDRNGILNLRLDYKLNDNFDMSVWGRNVTDERFFKFNFAIERGFVGGMVNDPATYGVTLRRKF